MQWADMILMLGTKSNREWLDVDRRDLLAESLTQTEWQEYHNNKQIFKEATYESDSFWTCIFMTCAKRETNSTRVRVYLYRVILCDSRAVRRPHKLVTPRAAFSCFSRWALNFHASAHFHTLLNCIRLSHSIGSTACTASTTYVYIR